MLLHIGQIDGTDIHEVGKQPVEQRNIAVRDDLQMHVRKVRRGRAAWVYIDDAHVRPRLFRCRNALIQHRMAPREVGAHKHDQIGLLQILIRPRHRIRAERTFVPRNR